MDSRSHFDSYQSYYSKDDKYIGDDAWTGLFLVCFYHFPDKNKQRFVNNLFADCKQLGITKYSVLESFFLYRSRYHYF